MFSSPRPPSSSYSSWIERYNLESEILRRELARTLRLNMASIIGHAPTSDVLLVSVDGRKFPAHLCILRQRAPSFFGRYVQSTLEAVTPRAASAAKGHLLEIAVGDVDATALDFFIRSIYTEEEVVELTKVLNGKAEDGEDGENEGDGDKDGRRRDYCGEEENDERRRKAEECEFGGGGRRMAHHGKYASHQHHQATPMNSQSPRSPMMPPASSSIHHPHQLMSASFPSPSAECEWNVPSNTLAEHCQVRAESTGSMTSFKELATAVGNNRRDQHKEVTLTCQQNIPSPTARVNPKFIRIAAKNVSSGEERFGKRVESEEKKIFPIFIGMDGDTVQKPLPSTVESSLMARSLPLSADGGEGGRESPQTLHLIGSIRGRAIARRRMSSTSSLTSIDLLTPTQEEALPIWQNANQTKSVSKLAEDLLQIFLEEPTNGEKGTKMVIVETKEGNRLKAPLCTLWANSEFFRNHLSTQLSSASASRILFRVPLRRFSSASVHFFLQFLHSGISALPSPSSSADLVDVWELFELGTFVNAELFIRMLDLNIRATLFHFFHRPCASCVSAVFDALPKMELEVPALRQLFDDALRWQAANFTRIWKGRCFLHLSEQWQHQCRDAVLQSVDEESVVEVLLGCEKLQVTLPRLKLSAPVQRVLNMVADVEEYCMELLVGQFDSLISSNAFSNFGKGLALNLALLEDVLPPLVHSLSAETAIRSFVALKELLAQIEQPESAICEWRDRQLLPSSVSSCTNSPLKRVPSQHSHQGSLFGSTGSICSSGRRTQQQLMAAEWNPRFTALCYRLFELIDRHMLHFANSILNSEEWALLNEQEQERIRELGLFVELRMPRAPPPRLSSFGRVYCKRSSSVGFGQNQQFGLGGLGDGRERTRSLERRTSSSSTKGTTATSSRPSLSTQMEEDRHEEEKEEEDEEEHVKEERQMEVEEEEGKTKLKEKEKKESKRVEGRNVLKLAESNSSSLLLNPNSVRTKIPSAKGKKSESDATKLKTKRLMKNESDNDANKTKMMEEEWQKEEKRMKNDLEEKEMKEERNKTKVIGEEEAHGKVMVIKKKEEAKDNQHLPLKEHLGRPPKAAKISQANAEIGVRPVIDCSPSSSSNLATKEHAQQSFDRQRTHTVMTVDQNVRAGIDAYLGGGSGGSGGSGRNCGNKSEEGTMPMECGRTGKPQSIVRPMPQQQKADEREVEGGHLPPASSRTTTGQSQMPTTSSAQSEGHQQKRMARTTRTSTAGGQMPRKAMTERQKAKAISRK